MQCSFQGGVGTSQFFLIVSEMSFAKVSLSVESTSLSEYTRVASCSHSLISSDVCFIASPVVNNIPWKDDTFTFWKLFVIVINIINPLDI